MNESDEYKERRKCKKPAGRFADDFTAAAMSKQQRQVAAGETRHEGNPGRDKT